MSFYGSITNRFEIYFNELGDKGYILLPLPGYTKDDISLTTNDKSLTINLEKIDLNPNKYNVYYKSIKKDKRRLSVNLGEFEVVNSSLENGILKCNIELKKQHLEKRIEIS